MDESIRRSYFSYGTTALLVTSVVLAIGCGNGASPVSPSKASVSGPVSSTTFQSNSLAQVPAQGKIEICHRTAGPSDFIAISIAPAALDAHLAHGDAHVGDPVPGQPGAFLGSDCVAISLAPVTITFAGLLVDRAAVFTYVESGVDIVATPGSWEAWTNYGHPAPTIVFWAQAGAPPTAGAIRVSAGGAMFQFTSVDLYSSTTPIPYVFAGYLNSSPVFTATGTVPNTFGNFATVSNPHANVLIDQLVITLTNAPAACCANPMGLDNLAVMK